MDPIYLCSVKGITYSITDSRFGTGVTPTYAHTPIINNEVANKKYVDDNAGIKPKGYLVALNSDGTIDTYSSILHWSELESHISNQNKMDYLDVVWGDSRFRAYMVEITDVNTGDIKFIGDVEYNGIQRRMVFTLTPQDVLTTTSITTSEIISNKKSSVVNNLSNDYYPNTNVVYNEFRRKPVVVWEAEEGTTGLLGTGSGISETPTWQLTNLDLTPYKYLRIYTRSNRKSSGVGVEASYTPGIVLELSLDSRAAGPVGGHYCASVVGQKPNDANRLYTVTCAVSADKTSFVVLRMSTLYGTAATDNSDCDAYVFRIEGCYD